MKTSSWITSLCAATLTAACGGGGSNTSVSPVAPVVVSPTVSSVTIDTLMYSKSARITVNGQNLTTALSLLAPGCDGVAQVAGATATQVVFTCKPVVSGALPISAQLGGATLAAISLVVPAPRVTMQTTLGQIVLELNPNKAPITVANFMQYVASGFYNGLIFHRVVPGFVIQGGGFNSSLQQATTLAPIKLEVPNGLSNIRGSIAMARTTAPDSATSQFFINSVDNLSLDTSGGGYAVFGSVVAGLNVADAIAAAPTQTTGGFSNVPVTPVVITSATQTQ